VRALRLYKLLRRRRLRWTGLRVGRGSKRVRVIGFFGGNTSMATFEKTLVPLEQPPSEPPFGERTLTIPPIVLEQPPTPLA
jgi:hypothetical protein